MLPSLASARSTHRKKLAKVYLNEGRRQKTCKQNTLFHTKNLLYRTSSTIFEQSDSKHERDSGN